MRRARRRRLSHGELVSRSRASLERIFGRHRGVVLRLVFCLPFLALGVAVLLCYFLTRLWIRILSWVGLERNVRHLRKQLHRATNVVEYEAIARQLDIAAGCESWKRDPQSNCYDWRRVILWTKALRAYRVSAKIHRLCDTLISIQNLKFGRIFTEEPYSYCHWGTKDAIETFLIEIQLSMKLILDYVKTMSPIVVSSPRSDEVDIPPSYDECDTRFPSDRKLLCDEYYCVSVAKFIEEFGTAWGRTALYLSGGGMIGFHHFGVGKALLQLDMIPTVLVGCSAGSAVAAWLGSRTDEDAHKELKGDIFARLFTPFESLGVWGTIKNLLFLGHLCSQKAWLQCARRIYTDLTLLEAYELTGRILNISACRADEPRTSYLLNYRTAPDVLLASAILASSAFPLLTAPFTLLEKSSNGDICQSSRFLAVPFRDGSLSADIPVNTIAREFDVGFSIVSQVNPHVYPFLGLQGKARAGRPARQMIVKHGSAFLIILSKMESFLREVMASIIRLGISLDVWPTIRGMDTSLFLNQVNKQKHKLF